jgi:hypothetical protein
MRQFEDSAIVKAQGADVRTEFVLSAVNNLFSNFDEVMNKRDQLLGLDKKAETDSMPS